MRAVSVWGVLIFVIVAAIVLVLGINWTAQAKEKFLADDAKNSACRTLATEKSCNHSEVPNILVEGFDANKDTDMIPGTGSGGDNLMTLCKNWYGANDADTCAKEVCGCK